MKILFVCASIVLVVGLLVKVYDGLEMLQENVKYLNTLLEAD